MTVTVTIPAIITGTVPHVYTDDDNIITGLTGGMHTVNLLPMYADAVLVALFAQTQADIALATAGTVAQSPYTQATSSTSLVVGIGSKSFTLNETGKAFSVGQTVNISDATATNTMNGVITDFTPATGAITVNVATIVGSGTISSWIISVGAVGGGISNALATSGAAVQINAATPPTTGQYLVATTPTTATWQDRIAPSLMTTGSPVQLTTSTPPTTGQLLTATSPTSANWQDAPKTTPDYLLINAGVI
jgi:hypothetical protein